MAVTESVTRYGNTVTVQSVVYTIDYSVDNVDINFHRCIEFKSMNLNMSVVLLCCRVHLLPVIVISTFRQ